MGVTTASTWPATPPVMRNVVDQSFQLQIFTGRFEKLSVLTSPFPSVKSDGTFNPFFRAAENEQQVRAKREKNQKI